VVQWVILALTGSQVPGAGLVSLALAALVLPLNLLLIGIDNTLFLLFPIRMVGAHALDFQTVGRLIVAMLGKTFCLFIAGSIAFGAGAIGYFLAGESWFVGLVASWLVLASFALAMMPLAGWAFRRFDVAGDVPV
jgi:hypothetical protein